MTYDYTPPNDDIFKEMQFKALCIMDEWKFAEQKKESIRNLKNVRDNAMYFWRRFDFSNQAKFLDGLSKETKLYIHNHL